MFDVAVAERLVQFDQQLGDPADPANPFSFAQALARDEAEAYPEDANAHLHELGFAERYIPRRYRGQFHSYEELLGLVRLLARRDLTAAIAQAVTYLGSLPVWVGGSEQQRYAVAERIRAQSAMAFGLTEQRHGTDILATEVCARHAPDGITLSGSKWLIGNGSRAQLMTVFAQTQGVGGTEGLSLYLVDKAALDPATLAHHPKIKTHGIRGADVSGVTFSASRLPTSAVIGKLGAGSELVLRALQVSRTLCAGLALGPADTALRTVLKFALNRQLYGGTVYDLPYPRALLRDAFADLLICDCVALSAARALHILPASMGTWSALVKYVVPTTIEQTLHSLTRVLGARFYLREGFEHGLFQKILRDTSIVSLFDGSTVVNLNVLIHHLRARQSRAHEHATPSASPDDLRSVFALAAPLPKFKPERLQLSSGGADALFDALPQLVAQLQQLPDQQRAQHLLAYVEQISQRDLVHQQRLAALREQHGAEFGKQPAAFACAQEHCALAVALSCIWMWLANVEASDDAFFHAGDWLLVCLEKLLRPLHLDVPTPTPAAEQAMDDQLKALYAADRLFSLVPLPIRYDHALTTL